MKKYIKIFVIIAICGYFLIKEFEKGMGLEAICIIVLFGILFSEVIRQSNLLINLIEILEKKGIINKNEIILHKQNQ